jgi:hypothetical protein
LPLHAVGRFKHFTGMPQGLDLVTNVGIYQTTTHVCVPDFFLLRTNGTDAANAAVATAKLALLVLAATVLSSLVAGVALRRTALVELLREE